MTASPLPMTYVGAGAFQVQANRIRLAEEHYGIGEVVDLAPVEQRSRASHAHYFAALHEAWQNLPDNLAERFTDVERLRKFSLIRTGFCDERSVVCASKAEARRMAAFIQPIDDYAVVVASEAVVTVYTAKSQSMKAMGKEAFGASKQAVLDFVSDLIGVEPSTLTKNTARAA